MIITNPYILVIALGLSLVVYIMYTKIWMIIANFIGEKFGIGKFIVKLFSRKKEKS